MRLCRLFLICCALPFAWGAQPGGPKVTAIDSRPLSAGDTPGEIQPPPSGFPIPPAPVLTPEESLRTFRLPPGYRIELVASEPLVSTPVAIDFDPDGRLWVIEMRGYQNDPEGATRLQPNGRVVVLEDTDDDGRMDKRTVFMEGLVLPRAIRVLSDGILVGEPPYVWLARDRDGDGRMDEKSVVVDDFGVRDGNPGHAPNGLLRGMDNWLHSPTYSARIRRIDGKWVKDAVPIIGHFGIGMDDFGRTYTNGNSAPLRVNLLSPHYQIRNPNHDAGGGVYEPMTGDAEREVFPARPNPGVNRGYVKGTLRSDGRLARNTAGCGISIFRGDRLPADVLGNHFFCEPAGNFVRRTILTEHPDGRITGVNSTPGAEFIASTEERFRPVNTATAPDGTLYVVDMHRGVLESHPFVTSYLKRQIHERGLLHPLDRGRIYRVGHESTKRGPKPQLSRASAADLVATLSHPNGWWRDTAQRLLVERADRGVVPALRTLARSQTSEIPRLHAGWSLEGLGALTDDYIATAAADSSPRIRAAAMRWAEARAQQSSRLASLVLKAANDPAAAVRLQATASMGALSAAQSVPALAELVIRHSRQPYLLDAAIFSLPGNEFELLGRLAASPAWADEKSERTKMLAALAAAIFRSGVIDRAQRLLHWASGDHPRWQRLAVLRSVTKPMRLAADLQWPSTLLAATDENIRSAAVTLAERLAPDKAGGTRPLTAAEKDLFESGFKLYGVYCAQCHQASGRGSPDTGPALIGSKWVLGSPAVLTSLVLYGKQSMSGTGPVMPPWGNVLDDRHFAAILTYIRREWGNQAAPVSVDQIRKVRAGSAAPTALWTDATLQALAENAAP